MDEGEGAMSSHEGHENGGGVTFTHHDMPKGVRREEGGRGGRRGVTLTYHVNLGRVKESKGVKRQMYTS